jgi:hypothetical protein
MNKLICVLVATLAGPEMGGTDGSKPSPKSPASGPKPAQAQTRPAATDHGLSQTRDGTLPAPVGTGPNKSIQFRVRTEGADRIFESNFQTDLKSTDQFLVNVLLQGAVGHGEAELAPEVARQIGLARPRNEAGRKAAFPRWHTADGGANYRGFVVPLGWTLNVEGVTPLPDGWRARVRVNPVARTVDGRHFTVYNCLFENYRFKDGKLKLESQAADLWRDPRDGLWGWVK